VTSEDHSAAGRGTLLLADISGYTAFLQAVAAAHAADMAAGRFVPKAYPLLTSLLDGIVGRIVPPFVLSKLEGDAVFAFAAEGEPGVRGQSVLDCLTACYDAYRARLDEARTIMACTCEAAGRSASWSSSSSSTTARTSPSRSPATTSCSAPR
jgi:hypothetical protein